MKAMQSGAFFVVFFLTKIKQNLCFLFLYIILIFYMTIFFSSPHFNISFKNKLEQSLSILSNQPLALNIQPLAKLVDLVKKVMAVLPLTALTSCEACQSWRFAHAAQRWSAGAPHPPPWTATTASPCGWWSPGCAPSLPAQQHWSNYNRVCGGYNRVKLQVGDMWYG